MLSCGLKTYICINTNDEQEQTFMKTQELKIAGMHCGHCVMSVRKELSKIRNLVVQDVQIGTARVQYDETLVREGDVAKAVDEAGYKLTESK
jgi:copper chaperone CopZ